MSADACAAAVGRGAVHRPRVSQSVRAGAVFGAIEAVTPLVGWMLGLTAARFVSAIDHWIAFVLLTGIGGKMIVEALGRKDANSDQETVRPSLAGLIATAIGTSIDAAAVGVTLAFLNANIFAIALAIGLATFGMSTIGMLIGRAVGARFGSVVELLGGAGLIAIGTKILLEHTGVIG
ncbi:manganese efflux pump MntP family protein [Sphingomonas sp. ID1715]|uniref:manganese efflux pump MntP n=1 Tax=Sphingomonas sp. ID1715 TaxID=1656898 RepID=UPI0020C5A2C8|nr:manganese efflux pump MntP family protein [Sphingomonas sp. ID1715]